VNILFAHSPADWIRPPLRVSARTRRSLSSLMVLDASAQAAQFLRVATIAVGAYDYLITIPAEYRFYKSQQHYGRIALSCVLFILIRYISVILVMFGAVVWFGTFSLEACKRWYILPPVFKVLQVMVSQFVLGIRAYNLSQRSRPVGAVILVLYIATCVAQWVANMYGRTPALNSDGTQCHRTMVYGLHTGPWIHYMVAIIYDTVVTAMSFRYMLKYYFSATTSLISRVTKMMMYDGLGYFVLITATNIFNLVLYRTNEDTQGAGVSLSYVATWIMTQRILIDLNEASVERRNRDSFVTISKTIKSADIVSAAIRAQFESDKDEVWTEPSLDVTSSAERGEQLNVQVRVERTLRVEDHPWLLERGICRSRRTESAWVSAESWSTATHDTQDERIRPMRDPMMVTVR